MLNAIWYWENRWTVQVYLLNNTKWVCVARVKLMTYKAGQILEISSNGQLTQKLDEDCQKYLSLSPWPRPSLAIKCAESMFNVYGRKNEKKAKKKERRCARTLWSFYEWIWLEHYLREISDVRCCFNVETSLKSQTGLWNFKSSISLRSRM